MDKLNKFLTVSFLVIAEMAWFMLGMMCCLSPFMLMADNKLPGIIFLCLFPFWVGANIVFNKDFEKLFKEIS